jgi:mannitol/fructose-specific phosphotransferase system IIA component (Ntr-type)
MFTISNLVRDNGLVLDLGSENKNEALKDMLRALAKAGKIEYVDTARLFRGLLQRERLGSTEIGQGVALPHLTHSVIVHPVVAIARFKDGVDWGSRSKTPAQMVFLVLTSSFGGERGSEISSRIVSLVKRHHVRNRLLMAEREQVVDVIRKEETTLFGPGEKRSPFRR